MTPYLYAVKARDLTIVGEPDVTVVVGEDQRGRRPRYPMVCSDCGLIDEHLARSAARRAADAHAEWHDRRGR